MNDNSELEKQTIKVFEVARERIHSALLDETYLSLLDGIPETAVQLGEMTALVFYACSMHSILTFLQAHDLGKDDRTDGRADFLKFAEDCWDDFNNVEDDE